MARLFCELWDLWRGRGQQQGGERDSLRGRMGPRGRPRFVLVVRDQSQAPPHDVIYPLLGQPGYGQMEVGTDLRRRAVHRGRFQRGLKDGFGVARFPLPEVPPQQAGKRKKKKQEGQVAYKGEYANGRRSGFGVRWGEDAKPLDHNISGAKEAAGTNGGRFAHGYPVNA